MLKNVISKIETGKRVVLDQEVKQTIQEMKLVRNPIINLDPARARNGEWQRPEYNFDDIDRFADVDGYVLQSFRKKLGLFIKEGYDFVGERPELVDYVKKRISQIAIMSNTTEHALISTIYSNLSRFSNCYLALVRNSKSSGGYPYNDPRTKKRLDPIAGMFVIPTSTIEMKTDDDNHVTRYRQYVRNTKRLHREYNPENVLHFYLNRKDGFSVGTPRILPVLEDVKALRRIEENVEILVIQNIFPIIHYKVGTPEMPARADINGVSEVAFVSAKIEAAPPEGVYVTPERHDLKMIGTEGRALRVETYLDYFKKRVLAGLSMSTVDVGEGGTANRNTADTMSRALIDEVKSDQRIFEDFFNSQIINQLLMEAGEVIDITDTKNQVYLRFREIDVDSKIKRENHSIQKWLQNGITHQEFRRELGYNEMSEEEWGYTYHKLITEALALLSGASDPGSVIAQTAANAEHSPIEQGDLKKASAAQEKTAKVQTKAKAAIKPPSGGTVANRNRPANQRGTKTGPAKSLKDSMLVLDTEIDDMKSDIILRSQNPTMSSPNLIIGFYRGRAMDRILNEVRDSYFAGISSVGGSTEMFFSGESTVRLQTHEMMVKDYVNSLFDDILSITKQGSVEDAIDRIDAIHYRLAFISRTEKARAFNWGAISGLLQLGENMYNIDIGLDTDDNEIAAQRVSHSVADATLRSIPPWHPNSTVKIVRV